MWLRILWTFSCSKKILGFWTLHKLTDSTAIAYMVLIVFAVPLYLKLEMSGSNDSL